jgi:hypothetical protein
MIRKEIYQQAKLLGLRCQSYETFSPLIDDFFPKKARAFDLDKTF